MRFFLDNDVDMRCRRVLHDRGHEVLTTSDAGRFRESDDAQAVFAAEQHAALITHDREFTSRQRRNTAGRHIRLCCVQPDGPQLLAKWVDSILSVLEHREFVVIELRVEKVVVVDGANKDRALRRRHRGITPS